MMLKFSSGGMCWLHGGELKEVHIASSLKNLSLFIISRVNNMEESV